MYFLYKWMFNQPFDLNDGGFVHLVADHGTNELSLYSTIFHDRILVFSKGLFFFVQNGFQPGKIFFGFPYLFGIFKLPDFMLKPKIEQGFLQIGRPFAEFLRH
jgi:hypothetical protein